MTPPIPQDFRVMGPLKPMRFEAVIEDVVVTEGQIPEELNGGFYRVGPTWKRPSKQGVPAFAMMDGMVQAMVFREGRADFRNRWIRTPKYLAEERAGRALFSYEDGGFGDLRSYGWGEVVRDQYTHGIPSGTNIVNIFPFAGEMLASGEQGSPPIALDPVTLETKGIVPWSTKLSQGLMDTACYGDGAFTAHPKWDPRTGELFGWTYRDGKPYATLHWVKPDGTVRTRDLHDAPYNSNVHDMWLTESYVVLPFQPFIIDRSRIARGRSLFSWEPDRPTVLGLIPREDIDGPIRWIEADIEPQYVMHTLSANHVNGSLVLDAPIFDRPPLPYEEEVEFGHGAMGRWELDLETGKLKSERVADERAVDFPKIDERYYGMPYDWGFLCAGSSMFTLDTVIRRNVRTGVEDSYQVTRDDGMPVSVFEPTFAPRSPEAPEADGYLIVPISHFTDNTSEYLILDTLRIADGPVARIELPFQIGWTPHGHWMDFRAPAL